MNKAKYKVKDDVIHKGKPYRVFKKAVLKKGKYFYEIHRSDLPHKELREKGNTFVVKETELSLREKP